MAGGGYCKHCVLFSSASKDKQGVFVKTLFKIFSKAKKRRVFKQAPVQ